MRKGVFITGILSALLLYGMLALGGEIKNREVKVTLHAGVEDAREALYQGEAFLIRVESNPSPVKVDGIFAGRELVFQEAKQGEAWYSVSGIDLKMIPGKYPIKIKVALADGTSKETDVILSVKKQEFPVEHLTLPPEMTELDEAALRRVREDSAAFAALWNKTGASSFLQGKFERPVPGDITSAFGRRRIINGEPKSPHTGQDLRAGIGEEIRATNAGRVVLIRDCFFSGKSVVIDHGAGIYSMYFHLSEYSVEPGDDVEKGQVIGKAGSTGRSTASHLHWGFRVMGARVDPESVLALGPMLDNLQ